MKLLMGLICMLGFYQSASAITVRSAYKSDLCMDVNRGDPANWRFNTNVEVFSCNGEGNQQFALQGPTLSGTTSTFSLQALGKCMDVDMGYQETWTHQTNVQLFNCNGGVNQQFSLQSQGNGWFLIRSMLDGRCLDIDLNTGNGWRFERNVQLWSCNGQPNQLWRFEAKDGSNGDIIIVPGRT